MMLCINRYENYTGASCNSFQTSAKVLKRCNNQMIRYRVFNVIDSVYLYYNSEVCVCVRACVCVCVCVCVCAVFI